MNVKSVVFTTNVVESGRFRAACGGGSSAPRSKAPRVTTSGGNVYLNGNVREKELNKIIFPIAQILQSADITCHSIPLHVLFHIYPECCGAIQVT